MLRKLVSFSNKIPIIFILKLGRRNINRARWRGTVTLENDNRSVKIRDFRLTGS